MTVKTLKKVNKHKKYRWPNNYFKSTIKTLQQQILKQSINTMQQLVSLLLTLRGYLVKDVF